MEVGDNSLRTLYVYLQPLWYNGPENLSNSLKKTQNNGYVQGHSRSSTSVSIESRMWLTISSNWHSSSYRFGVTCIAAYCSHFSHFAFLSHPLGGLGTTYDFYLGLIAKCVVDFLLVLIELFSLGVTVTAESLRAKRDWKSPISL